ncbi:MAG: CDC48 family AAA ATPase [Thermoplasmatales archaeon]|nr:MAG: CDC48 family AAA ATPase [Thermoplasmatales archaeon]
MQQDIVLKVSEAFQQDVGYGRARIDHQTRIDLDLSIGDVIEIEGTKTTAASVWRAHPSDEGKKIIRIDNLTRKNAGTGLGERVKIRRADVREAREVVLAPLMPEGQRVEFGLGIDTLIRKNLLRRPITKSDEITIPGIAFFGSALPFVIVDTSPHGIVSITERTVLNVKEEAAKMAEEVGPRVSYEDIGGLHNEILKVREMIELPLKHPELFDRLGIDPPKGVLLHGPPGTGKTLIAKAVANESGANFYTINGPEIMSKFYGQSEENLRKIFEEAQKNAPSIVFLDEIDAIAPKRSEVHGEVERRVVSQLLTLMDGLKGRGKLIVIGATNIPDTLDPALRRPGRFDREIRIEVPDREGRKEILQIHTRGMPIDSNLDQFYSGQKVDTKKTQDVIKKCIEKIRISDLIGNLSKEKEKSRRDAVGDYLKVIFSRFKTDLPAEFFEKLVALLTDEITILLPYDTWDSERGLRVEHQIDERFTAIKENPGDFIKRIAKEIILDEIADITYGFVGADLAALAREAAMNALRRYLPEIDLEQPIPPELLEKMEVTMADFKNAHRGIEPSAIREFFIEVPKVTWADIGGLEEVKQNLRESVEWPLTQPEVFKRMGIEAPRGILLYGPPGTGKTLLAKAVANESNANFISIKGPEVLSKWVGESEKAVRELFKKARQVAPTIVFLDEIDSIAPRRGVYAGSHVTESVVNQLLTSIDGLESMEGVVVIGASNKPDILDPALLRPGRFDRLLMTPAPDKKSRFEIFKIHTRDMPITLTEDEVRKIDKEFEQEKIEVTKKDAKSIVNIKELPDKEKLLYLLADKTEGFSGADIEGLCREAAMLALRSDIKAGEVTKSHFLAAMKNVRPSITKDLLDHYEKLKETRTADILRDDKKGAEFA